MKISPSEKSLRIVQLSDCHVSADPEAAYRGQSADGNLAALLPVIRAWQPEFVLLTGDVSEDASAASYERVAAMLSTAGAPVLALPGNHDKPAVMSRFFPSGPWDGLLELQVKRWQLLLLDSTATDRVSGELAALKLNELKNCLEGSDAEHILVALHHQPVPVNAAWIDRYALESPESLFDALDRDPRIRCICWGHVHQDFRAQRNGVALLGAPSSAANSLPHTNRFTPDPAGPCCRWLELNSNGDVETGILGLLDQSSTGKTSHKIK